MLHLNLLFQLKNLTFFVILSIALSGCADSAEDNKSHDVVIPKTVQPIDAVKELPQQRVIDLIEIVIALERYKQENHSYPMSSGSGYHPSGRNWDSVVSNSGETSNWIEGLSPKYLASIPVDPRRDNIPAHQYIYKSNGAHYKLIALKPDDCREVKRFAPELIDRHRGGCMAYGFWTHAARRWK